MDGADERGNSAAFYTDYFNSHRSKEALYANVVCV
jgi:hypothetical protein